ncbi:MAG: YIP1 family protein [Calditrichae bacterium]|nr:YIP1 family protein [Calditrichia bacterium]
MQTFINIFAAPTKAFESLNEKPTWLAPLLIMIIAFIAFQYLTMDYSMQYQIQVMEAKDVPQERIDLVKQQMQGGLKYAGMITMIIFIPLVTVIFAAVILGLSKITIAEGITFKKSLSIVSWSGMIGLISLALTLLLVYSKGTMHGIAIDLSAVLPQPGIGESVPLLNRILAKIDPFVIWQLVLWVIGLRVMGKTSNQKAAIPVGIAWGIWIVLSVSLAGLFENFGM